jgi:hypothetical protein
MFNAISRIFSASFLFEEVNGESAVGSSKFCHAIYQFRPPLFSIIPTAGDPYLKWNF